MNRNVKIYTFIALTLSLLFYGLARADEIDLVWSTFLGGSSGDWGNDIYIDDADNVYLAGYTHSGDFPITAGAFDTTDHANLDVFAAMMYPTGNAFHYATYLGGDDYEECTSLIVDDIGNAYLTGFTFSNDFPTTAAAFDTSFNGDADAFLIRLNSTGSTLGYATFLGGSSSDGISDIALDKFGNILVTGSTSSFDFPTTPGAFDTSFNGYSDAFVVKLNVEESILEFATFLGGNREDYSSSIAFDAFSNVYIAGYTEGSMDFPITALAFDNTLNGGDDAFVIKLNAMGSALHYSTFLGGSDYEDCLDIALDTAGNAYLTGRTSSYDFPTTTGAFDTSYNGGFKDVYVAKLIPTGSNLDYSTFLGGSGWEEGYAIAVDVSSNAYVTGCTDLSDFPTTMGAFDTSHNGGFDAFVAKLNFTGSALDYATFIGGSGGESAYDIALDNAGNVYVIGETSSFDFPTTTRVIDTTYNGSGDAFVTKLNMRVTHVQPDPPGFNLPKTLILHQNYPNPFNVVTEITYQIPQNSHVSLKIYNVIGQEIKTLVESDQQAGNYAVTWDGSNASCHEAASGLYFCKLQAGELEKIIKMVLLH